MMMKMVQLLTGEQLKQNGDVYMENRLVFQLAKQIIDDMSTLNQYLFRVQENFEDSSSKINVIHEIPLMTDVKNKMLVDQIDEKLKKISLALTDESQIEPLNKEDINRIMVEIMIEYCFINMNIKPGGIIGQNYTSSLDRIRTAISGLSLAIDEYNVIAGIKDWPRIQSNYESLSMAKQQILSLE
jgi:hypothetical protein